MKVIVVFEIIVSIAVTVSFAIVQGDQEACPKVCTRCSPEHRHLNGTVLNLIHAFCKWKSGNKLTDVPSTLPSNLGVLRLTSHNINLLRKTSLRPFGLLHQLYFDKNRLQRIENGSFSQQRYLKELDLKDNELTNIGRETFQGLVSLEILRLDHNKISHISRGTFEFTSSIKYIDLQKNNLQTLDESAFDRLDYLEKLLLNYNLLNAIDRGHFGNLMSLSRLELGFNQIGKVDSEAFSCAPLIKNLVINKNKLKAIPVGSIHQLGVLESLELSGNPINFVESSALVGLENLKVLDLSRCNISFIQRGAFNDLKMVKTIHLQQNPLDCDCHMTWLRRWLSWKPDVTLLGAVCVYPSGVSNQSFTMANLSSFICTCETCFKDALCIQGQMKNCSCFGNWTGQSCHGICHLSNTTGNACRYMGGKCLCENESVPLAQNQNVGNCSFNMTSQKCSENGKIQKVGSHLDCVCSDGFTGDGINCTDIDECEAEHKSCTSKHAGCVNTLGSYHCACHEGFKDANPGLPPGITCVDIDECNEISKTCHENAACNNVPGSYICSCLPGYTGSGKICYPVPKEPTDLTVTETGSGTVSVTWGISNTSTITRFTVEYKALGIHGPEWERVVVINDPPRDKLVVNLTNLVPGSTYVLRVGVFTIYNNSVYSKEQLFAAAALSQVPNTEQTTEGTSQKVKSALLALGLVVAVVVLVVISIGIHRFVRKKKKGNRNSNPQYAPGLEDLIEMRAHSQSGREVAERLASDFFEHGSTVSHPKDLTNQWEVPRDKLVIGQKIGEGQFGLVLEGTLLTDDGPMKVAVKTLKEPVHRFDYRDLIQEMEMMKEIGHHPHVISLLGTCTTPGPLYIITEFVSGGNLLDYLRSSRPSDETYVNIISTLSSRDLLKIALDVARGMNHIAKKKFVHRDLAARNVLLTEDFEAKVADFGLTRDIYGDGQYVKTGGGRVPIKWMAPESIQDQIYTTKSDVWAFGVLLWEIVTIGSSPYPCVPVSLLLSKLLCGYRMSKPAHCSDELHDLMKMCWELDPEARPTFSEICESLSDMLSESARSYVNITVSDERLAREPNVMDDGQQQSTAV